MSWGLITIHYLYLIVSDLNSRIIFTSHCEVEDDYFEVEWTRYGEIQGRVETLEFRFDTTTLEGRAATGKIGLIMEPNPDARAQKRFMNLKPGLYRMLFDPDNSLGRAGRVGNRPISLFCPPTPSLNTVDPDEAAGRYEIYMRKKAILEEEGLLDGEVDAEEEMRLLDSIDMPMRPEAIELRRAARLSRMAGIYSIK